MESPKGSKYPRGGRAPSSPSKLIFRAEFLELMRAAGEKAATLRREAKTARAWNIFGDLCGEEVVRGEAGGRAHVATLKTRNPEDTRNPFSTKVKKGKGLIFDT